MTAESHRPARRGLMLILSSPSGAGKTTLTRNLKSENNLDLSISVTTRTRRPSEIDGVHYRFIDRMKDAIRRRGENISSWEVEQVLLSHPAVASCAVYAVPSELGEDEVMAAILPEAGQAIDPAELLDFCSARLAYFAVPRFVDFVTELPLTETARSARWCCDRPASPKRPGTAMQPAIR